MLDGWNKLWGAIPNSGAIGTILAVIGAAIFFGYFVVYLWQKRKGGGAGFPWMALIIGGVLAMPQTLIPLVARLADVVITLGSALITWVIGRF